MDLRRKVQKVALDGVGDLYLKQPTAMCRMRLAIDSASMAASTSNALPSKEAAEAVLRTRAEMIAECLLDENGKPMFHDGNDVEQNLNPDLVKPLAELIDATYPTINTGEAAKNSQSDQA